MKHKKKSLPDLTGGPILTTLTRLAAPIMATAFLMTAYNLTDIYWIGLLGAKAVAGVGVGGMYLWLSSGLISLARMGGQVLTAQMIGAGRRQEAEDYARGALHLAVVSGILFGAACLLFPHPLVAFFRITDETTHDYAVRYLMITGGCTLFSYLTQVYTGLFTAQGDARTPFFANLLGLGINMVLDPLLIHGLAGFPRLGVTGAAIATVFAQFSGLVFLFFCAGRDPNPAGVLRTLRLFRRSGGRVYKNILVLGFPTAIQNMMYCGFSMILARMIAVFGDGAIAVQRVGGQIESLSWNVADGFAAALNAFTAQNYGAGLKDRFLKGYRASFLLLGLWGCAVAAAFFFLPRRIATLFFHEADVITIAVSYLRIISICEPFMCIEIMTVGALSALGKTRLASLISITLTGLRVPLICFLGNSAVLGLDGFWWGLSVTSVLKGIVFPLTWRRVVRPLPQKASS